VDFFASQELARRNTRKLIFLLIVTVLALIAAIYLLVILIFGGASMAQESLNEVGIPRFFSAENGLLIAGIGSLVIGIVSVGSLMKTSQLRHGGATVANMLGGRRLLPNTANLAERRILNIVEEMALASGVPVPPVYVMDNEPGINAFAAGHTIDDAVIGLNQGTLDQLNRDELQGVIAHEFSHILNGDMRMSLRMIGLLFGIQGIALIGTHLMRMASHMSHRSSRDKGGNAALAFVLFGAGLLAIGSIGLFFARLIKASISRQREYLADASAVQFTRLPDGIAGALKMIGANKESSRVHSPDAESISHMYFANMFGSNQQNLFATHPPLIPRIQRIEPQFAGNVDDYIRRRARADTLRPKDEEKEHQRRLNLARQFGLGLEKMGATGFPGLSESGSALPINPALIIASIGSPNEHDVAYSRLLVGNVPDKFLQDCRDVFTARCIVFASLLDAAPTVLEKQLNLLAQHEPDATVEETVRQNTVFATIPVRFRLPIFEILQGTLVGLSQEQFQHFQETLKQLVIADKKIDLFEFFLLHHLLVHLRRHLGLGIKNAVRYEMLSRLPDQVELVLSIVARQGHLDAAEAKKSFSAAVSLLSAMPRPLSFTGGDWNFQALNDAIKELSALSFQAKKELLTALATSVIHDGTITHSEAELFRAIAESLDCPVPPIIATENQILS
jgi:Zn-dependent protease with chaperone function